MGYIAYNGGMEPTTDFIEVTASVPVIPGYRFAGLFRDAILSERLADLYLYKPGNDPMKYIDTDNMYRVGYTVANGPVYVKE
mgnify:CR=1 FL=1